jgi:YggT family protein
VVRKNKGTTITSEVVGNTMFAVSNLLIALAKIVDIVLTIVYWLILVRAVISWVNPDPFNPLVQFLYKTTEPILEPIRRLLPPVFRFGIDISPIIAFLTILFVRSFFVKTLIDISLRL